MDPKGAKMVKGAVILQGSDLGSFYKAKPQSSWTICLFGPYFRRLRSPIGSYSLKKIGIYFKASCLKIFWAVQMIKIVFACTNSNRPKLLWYMLTILYLPSRKSASKTIDDRNHNVFKKLLLIMGWDGWKEMGIQYCPWAILQYCLRAILVFHLH